MKLGIVRLDTCRLLLSLVTASMLGPACYDAPLRAPLPARDSGADSGLVDARIPGAVAAPHAIAPPTDGAPGIDGSGEPDGGPAPDLGRTADLTAPDGAPPDSGSVDLGDPCALVPELCNGRDDNCDGETDEGFAFDLACDPVGECESAEVRCTADGEATECVQLGGTEERCNDLDDDCDGQTDEGFAFDLPCVPAGECGSAEARCTADGEGTECVQLGLAQERCNGLDDDCDGDTDEDLDPPLADRVLGICFGLLQRCGGRHGWLEPDYGAVAGYEETEQSCDGLDNDCDGATDEELSPPAADRQLGVCLGSLRVCGGEAGWLEPRYEDIESYESVEQSCDELDNDCDGEADAQYGTGQHCPGVGQCAHGVVVCAPDVRSTFCLQVGATEERCNGLDDDCDGTIDEGFLDLPGCVPLGECERAHLRCGADELSSECVQQDPNDEQCDGLDNDCNGVVDDITEPAPHADLTDGVCAVATKVCDGHNGWVEPDYELIEGYQRRERACTDGRDNDCDGLTDDDDEATCD